MASMVPLRNSTFARPIVAWVHARPFRRPSAVGRGRGDRRPDPADLRFAPGKARAPGAGRGRLVHRRVVLVHVLDLGRQPGRDHRASVLRHLRRDRPDLGGAVRRSNPSSDHHYATAPRAALHRARDQVAALIGATADSIIFTGSGSEADNLAVRGAVLTTGVERPQVNPPTHRASRDLNATVSMAGCRFPAIRLCVRHV